MTWADETPSRLREVGYATNAADGEPSPRYGARAVRGHGRRDRDDRKITVPASQLDDRPARSRGEPGHPDLGHELTGADVGREVPNEEIVGGDHSLAVRAGEHDLGSEESSDERVFTRWIVVGEAATDRAPASDLDVPDVADGVDDQGIHALDDGRRLDRAVASQRPDGEPARGLADVAQVGDVVDVDEVGGPR